MLLQKFFQYLLMCCPHRILLLLFSKSHLIWTGRDLNSETLPCRGNVIPDFTTSPYLLFRISFFKNISKRKIRRDYLLLLLDEALLLLEDFFALAIVLFL